MKVGDTIKLRKEWTQPGDKPGMNTYVLESKRYNVIQMRSDYTTLIMVDVYPDRWFNSGPFEVVKET